MHRKTIKQLRNDIDSNKISVEDLFTLVSKDLNNINSQLDAITRFIDYKENNKSDDILSGIPYVMKDLVATKGILTTSSSSILEEFKPPYSATIFQKLSDSNAMMVAKSNLDQFGIGGTNENSIYGYSRNPYNTNLTTGGSSGGSAAVVAAGSVPFSIGSDTGDSTRKPAAYCGIYGFKPTWSVVSRYGVYPYASSFDQVGVFTRCLDDIAIVLENINGPDNRDSTSLIHQKEMFYENLEVNKKALKVGYLKPLVASFDNEIVLKQFDETLEYLKTLGHEIIEIDFDIDLLRAIRGVYQIIVNAESASNLGDLTGVHFGKQILADDVNSSFIATRSKGLTKFTKARNVIGSIALREANKEEFLIKAKKIRRIMIEKMDDVFKEVDIVVAPSVNNPSFDPTTITITDHSDVALIAENHLALTNLIGACGLSIPTHMHDNLPYGISFMAKPFNDQLLLNFGKQFETGLLDENFLGLQSFYNVYKEVL